MSGGISNTKGEVLNFQYNSERLAHLRLRCKHAYERNIDTITFHGVVLNKYEIETFAMRTK